MSPVKIKEQKSQWPFLQRRGFPGLFPLKISSLRVKFRFLVFNKIFTKLRIYFKEDIHIFGVGRRFYDQVPRRKYSLFLVWGPIGTNSWETVKKQCFCGIPGSWPRAYVNGSNFTSIFFLFLLLKLQQDCGCFLKGI